MKNTIPMVLSLALTCTAAIADTGADAAADFIAPGPEARELLGPLFWLHGDESPELLREYVGIVAEGGNGCFTAESRPHADWLGEGWYRDLAICLEAAKKHNLKMWIFDEEWWPSGEVGGMVPRQYASKRLRFQAHDAGPDEAVRLTPGGDELVAALAGRLSPEGVIADTVVDITQAISGGELHWQAPGGDWRVLLVTWEYSHDRGGRGYLVDGASKDAVQWYLDTVYAPHYEHFGEDFGRAIPGFFYDEPETLGDWGTEVIPVLRERGVDWKLALFGYGDQLAGAADAAGHYQYLDAFTEAWGRTLYGGITEWCHERDVTSIGHWLEHNFDYLHPHRCGGNMFAIQKYTDMGGIDAIGSQFIPGHRDMSLYYTPKLGSSISHAYGAQDDLSMVEIYGARGQDIGYPEMKWWLDRMQVCGVNFIIPHAFNPRSPFDKDCPPYFYNNGYEARWPLYPVFADYSVRLSEMLSGGRHVCPVALLFLGHSHHVGASVLPEQLTGALQDALYDADWIPYDVLQQDMGISGNELTLRDERYRVLAVPAVEVIPVAALEKALRFLEAGGIVVGHGYLPSKPADLGLDPGRVSGLCTQIWGPSPRPSLRASHTHPSGGRAYLLPEAPTRHDITQALTHDAGLAPTLEVLDGATSGWLHVLHRVKHGNDVFLVVNQAIDGGVRRFRMRARAEGTPSCWDPMRAEIRAVPHERHGEHVEFDFPLSEMEAQLLVFQKEPAAYPPRLPHGIPPDAEQRTVEVVSHEEGPLLVPPGALEKVEEAPWKGVQWIWHAGDPEAPMPGTRCFRHSFSLPARAVAKAEYRMTADNTFRLELNGQEVMQSATWERPRTEEVTRYLQPGPNHIVVEAYNGGGGPNPAGLAGVLHVTFEDATSMRIPTGSGWESAEVMAGEWKTARVLGPFGMPPWGDVSAAGLTLPPVKRASPLEGQVSVPNEWLSGQGQVYLWMRDIPHEAAARITVNGAYAGGVIGDPLRLDVTRMLRPGNNALRIEPFGPAEVRLFFVRSGVQDVQLARKR